MLEFGRFRISHHNLGFFRLDGGAMFGSVPKNLWNKKLQADAENCIRLATRSLLIRDDENRVILCDVGLGEKWEEKQRRIFAIDNTPRAQWGFPADDVTDIVLTHLHFDHAGGISRWKDGDTANGPELCFPQAAVHLQKANYENALAPNPRERASYLPENVRVLENSRLNLVGGDAEILPGVFVRRVDGHTRGQQVVEIRDQGTCVLFPTDLVPTSHHLPLPFNMGYDICSETLLAEKDRFLSYAMQQNAIVVFQHDPDVPAARVGKDERGHYCVKERVAV